MGRFDLEVRHNMVDVNEVCVKATGNLSALQVFFNSAKALYKSVLKNKAFRKSGIEYQNAIDTFAGEFTFGSESSTAPSLVESFYNELVALFNEVGAVEGVKVVPVPFLQDQKEESINYQAIQNATTLGELKEEYGVAIKQMSDIGEVIIDKASSLNNIWSDRNFATYKVEVQREIAEHLSNLGRVNHFINRTSDSEPDNK